MKKTALACALIATTFAPQAYAAGLPVVYGTQEKVIKVHELPNEAPFLAENGKYAVDVGYCYKQIRVFFLPIWNTNERYCGYINDETYTDTSREEFLEISKALSLDTAWDNGQPKIPFWDRIGGKLTLGGMVLLAGLWSKFKKRNEEDDDE